MATPPPTTSTANAPAMIAQIGIPSPPEGSGAAAGGVAGAGVATAGGVPVAGAGVVVA